LIASAIRFRSACSATRAARGRILTLDPHGHGWRLDLIVV
jgi:hypothetical protein